MSDTSAELVAQCPLCSRPLAGGGEQTHCQHCHQELPSKTGTLFNKGITSSEVTGASSPHATRARAQEPEALTLAKKFPWAPFALILICFFLPFFEVSCQGRKLTSLTGMQLAFGTEVQEPSMFGPSKTRKVAGDSLALLTFLVAAAGIGLSFIKGKLGFLLPAICGAVGLLLMLITKSRIDDEVIKQSSGMLTVEYAFGFIATCLLFLIAAAGHGYLYHLEKKAGESG